MTDHVQVQRQAQLGVIAQLPGVSRQGLSSANRGMLRSSRLIFLGGLRVMSVQPAALSDALSL